jgi:hypothetical protein
MLNRHRKLRMEQMERRELMAGDMAVFMQNGNLFINEQTGQAGRDNAVSIERLNDTTVKVTGLPTLADGTLSTVNGHASQNFTINANTSLFVNLGGGNDAFTFAPIGGEIKFKEIHVDVAAPPLVATTRIASTVAQPTTFPGPDNDVVVLERFHTTGDVSINTGIGNDIATIKNARIGEAGQTTANVSINTGAGTDDVRVFSNIDTTLITGTLDVQTFSSLGESDADAVLIGSVGVQRDLHVRTGGGNDSITMTNVGVSHSLDFDAGAGADSASLDGVSATDALFAKLGDGDDLLSTSNLFSNNLTLDGGGGFDRLTKKSDPFFTGHRTQTGWETINGLSTSINPNLIVGRLQPLVTA